MLTVFCIRRAGDAPPPEGLVAWGADVRLLEEGPVGIWMVDKAPGPASVDSLRAHDAAVRMALRSATPLPTRYGTTFASAEEIRLSLRERQAELLAALERVSGRVEMGVRVAWGRAGEVPGAAPEPRSGLDYLRARRSELEARSEARKQAVKLLDQVEAKLGVVDYPSVRTVLPEPHVAGLLAHLVHREEVRAYRSRLGTAQRELPEVILHPSGPWAPYSFV